MPSPVTHFEVLGTDANALQRFYGEAFGWQMQDVMGGSYYMANPGDAKGINGGVGAAQGGVGHVTFYVEVPDVEAALAQAESLGGTRRMGPDQVPGGPVIGQFTDPEGHMIGVTQTAS